MSESTDSTKFHANPKLQHVGNQPILLLCIHSNMLKITFSDKFHVYQDLQYYTKL